MLKPNRKITRVERGSLLVGAFMISMALAVALTALVSYSHTATRQAESLLSRSLLSRMADEKFTRDLLSLQKMNDSIAFDTATVLLDGGEAQSSLQAVPGGPKDSGTSLYLVVVATITKNTDQAPRHLKLETLLQIAPPPAPPLQPATSKRVPVSKAVENQLRSILPPDEAQIQELTRQVLSALKEQFGPDIDSLPIAVEMNQYREEETIEISAEKVKNEEDAFFMSPLSVEPPAVRPRVRVWKETYY